MMYWRIKGPEIPDQLKGVQALAIKGLEGQRGVERSGRKRTSYNRLKIHS